MLGGHSEGALLLFPAMDPFIGLIKMVDPFSELYFNLLYKMHKVTKENK